jgi:hypothetical protein
MPALFAAATGTGSALPRSPRWFEPTLDGGTFISRMNPGPVRIDSAGAEFRRGTAAVRLSWLGTETATTRGEQPLPSHSNYFVGSKSAWRSKVPHYGRVRTGSLYPGIDAVYYWRGSEFEFDLVVSPGSDPASIRFRLEGGTRARLNKGELVVSTGAGEWRLEAPVAYQETTSGRVPVAARFRLRGNEVSFALGRWDRSRELVIDPVVYASYFGGDYLDGARASSLDSRGHLWVAGYSQSVEGVAAPLPPAQDGPHGKRDAYLAKFEPLGDGTMVLAYYTFWGGSGNDEATAVTADANGFVYLTGFTDSQDFPLAGTSLVSEPTREVDAFLTVLRPEAPDLQFVWYSATYGGPGRDFSNAIALDPAGDIFIGGHTTSENIPGAEGSFQHVNRGGWDGWFIRARITASPALVFATFIGGNSTDVITGLAVDRDSHLWLSGYSASQDFPVTVPPATERPQSALDMVLAKMDLRLPGLDALVFGLYLNGNALDVPTAMKIGSDGALWIAGYTTSTDLPATETAYRSTLAGDSDAFLMRWDPLANRGSEITYLTYLGGGSTDVCYDLALGNNRVALAGYTLSADFPHIESSPAEPIQAIDGFISVIDPRFAGNAGLVLSRRLGGASIDLAAAVELDASGNALVSGVTSSLDIPVTDNSFKRALTGAEQSFVMTVAPANR